jgi:ATP-dependent helicase HrpA
LPPYQRPLVEALAAALRELTGVVVPADAWAPEKLPDHLRITVRVTGERDRTLAEGKDVAVLRDTLRPAAAASLAAAASSVERSGLRQWTIGTLPRQVELSRAGHPVTAYPALVDAGDAVDVRVLPTEPAQAHHMPRGTRKLLLLNLPSPVGYVSQRLSDPAKLALLQNPHGGVRPLLADCAGAAVDALVAGLGGPAWDQAGFGALRDQVAGGLNRATLGVVTDLLPVLALANQLTGQLDQPRPAAQQPAAADLRAQLAGLVRPGFVTELGWHRLPDLHRWLQAAQRRLAKLPADPERDRQAMAAVHRVQQAYQRARDELPDRLVPPELAEIGWMIEELRVSLFAQQLGTAYPVSEKRIQRALNGFTG